MWAYCDSSALVKRYVREPGRQRLLGLLRERSCVSSALTPVELRSAFRRRVHEGTLDVERLPGLLRPTGGRPVALDARRGRPGGVDRGRGARRDASATHTRCDSCGVGSTVLCPHADAAAVPERRPATNRRCGRRGAHGKVHRMTANIGMRPMQLFPYAEFCIAESSPHAPFGLFERLLQRGFEPSAFGDLDQRTLGSFSRRHVVAAGRTIHNVRRSETEQACRAFGVHPPCTGACERTHCHPTSIAPKPNRLHRKRAREPQMGPGIETRRIPG